MGRYLPHGQEPRTAEANNLDNLQDRRQAVWLGEVEAPRGASGLKVPGVKKVR
jgi:hypothetical protein